MKSAQDLIKEIKNQPQRQRKDWTNINITVESDVKNKFFEIAQKEGITISKILKSFINEFIEEHEHVLKNSEENK